MLGLMPTLQDSNSFSLSSTHSDDKTEAQGGPPTDGASSQLVSRKMAAQEKQGSSVRACLVPSWTGAGHDCSGC